MSQPSQSLQDQHVITLDLATKQHILGHQAVIDGQYEHQYERVVDFHRTFQLDADIRVEFKDEHNVVFSAQVPRAARGGATHRTERSLRRFLELELRAPAREDGGRELVKTVHKALGITAEIKQMESARTRFWGKFRKKLKQQHKAKVKAQKRLAALQQPPAAGTSAAECEQNQARIAGIEKGLKVMDQQQQRQLERQQRRQEQADGDGSRGAADDTSLGLLDDEEDEVADEDIASIEVCSYVACGQHFCVGTCISDFECRDARMHHLLRKISLVSCRFRRTTRC